MGVNQVIVIAGLIRVAHNSSQASAQEVRFNQHLHSISEICPREIFSIQWHTLSVYLTVSGELLDIVLVSTRCLFGFCIVLEKTSVIEWTLFTISRALKMQGDVCNDIDVAHANEDEVMNILSVDVGNPIERSSQ